MSDQPTQSSSTTELDARVEELIGQLGMAGAGDLDAPAATEAVVSPASEKPNAAVALDVSAEPEFGKIIGGPAEPQPAPAVESLLADLSKEIEQQAPGPLPTPPEPPPPDPTPVAAKPAPEPTPEEVAAAVKEIEADLTEFRPPVSEESGASAADAVEAPAPAEPVAADLAPPAPPKSVEPEPARPGAEIKKLDAALAAGAERALADAQRDLDTLTPVKDAASEVDVPAPAAPPPAPVHAASAPTAAEPAKPAPPAAKPAEPQPLPAPEHAEPKVAKRAPGEALAFLRPVAAVHEKLGESTRQTIAYCAIITVFFASCVWGRVLVFPPKAQLEPKTEAAEFYDQTTPAHGVTAPPRKPAEAAGEHGSGEEGHAEPKKDTKAKDAHAKPEKKSSSSHGESSHGSEAGAAKKSPKSKKVASAEEH